MGLFDDGKGGPDIAGSVSFLMASMQAKVYSTTKTNSRHMHRTVWFKRLVLPVGTISDNNSAVILAVCLGSMMDKTRYTQAYARTMNRKAMLDICRRVGKERKKERDGKRHHVVFIINFVREIYCYIVGDWEAAEETMKAWPVVLYIFKRHD